MLIGNPGKEVFTGHAYLACRPAANKESAECIPYRIGNGHYLVVILVYGGGYGMLLFHYLLDKEVVVSFFFSAAPVPVDVNHPLLQLFSGVKGEEFWRSATAIRDHALTIIKVHDLVGVVKEGHDI